VEVSVEGPPTARDRVKTAVNQRSDGLWLVEYTPLGAGPHHVSVYFSGHPVNNSPFTTHVKPRRYLSSILCK